MSAKANQVICAMYHGFVRDCKRLASLQREKDRLYDAYNSYRKLLREEEETRTRLVSAFGVLGVFSPEVSPRTAGLISKKPLNSDECRKDLKVWEILELYLSAKDDKSTVADFQGFLSYVGIYATAQAIDSAIKSHPGLFRINPEETGRTISLTRLSASL